MRRAAAAALLLLLGWAAALPAWAWNAQGHAVVVAIADRLLTPATRAQVRALLAADDGVLPATDLFSAATWADRYRDSDRGSGGQRYRATRQWHYVNLRVARPDMATACPGGFDGRSTGAASGGPAGDCIVTKILQFAAELRDAGTPPAERVLALKYLLHLVGDLHQPLHAADRDDHGGNAVVVRARGRDMRLHAYWDVRAAAALGADPVAAAARLVDGLEPDQRQAWAAGSPVDWAMESHYVAVQWAYGPLPHPGADGVIELDEPYLRDAGAQAVLQLTKAGVRLARMLEDALGGTA